jgi:hypothetical protein
MAIKKSLKGLRRKDSLTLDLSRECILSFFWPPRKILQPDLSAGIIYWIEYPNGNTCTFWNEQRKGSFPQEESGNLFGVPEK